ncbi:murein hydrolase activator EnvC family protein [Marmoricola sp. RAF53]|uniref:murein hydrolase activator EnvC family protein n=1 Tax=Marmoricola sp. RAF53 TaxID=3233059 RepID=UPI003F9CD81B
MTFLFRLLHLLGALALGLLPAPPAPVRAERAVPPLAPPRVVARFAPPDTAWTAGHRGVDLLGSPGQQVRAALAGTVTFAGVLAGRGVVVVAHGPRRTTYEPVGAWVRAGDVVGTGQAIGVLAPGPSHCAPRTCLHWGLREGEVYLDPLSLLGGGPVRLLPLASRVTPADEPAGRRSAAGPW